MGTRAATTLGLARAGPAAGVLEETLVNGSLPCQTGRIECRQDGPGCLSLLGGINEVAGAQGQCSSAETVDAGWVITREIGEPGDTWRRETSWAVTDTDTDSLQSGWKVGLSERLGACWEWQV